MTLKAEQYEASAYPPVAEVAEPAERGERRESPPQLVLTFKPA